MRNLKIKTNHWLLLGALATLLAGCSEPSSTPASSTSASGAATANPAVTAAEAMADEPEVDAAFVSQLPTDHWINELPIGNNEGPVTIEDLASGTANPERWLHYGGDYNNFRHSPITALNPDSISDLKVAWSFPTGTDGQFAMSPIVYDGIMYMTTSYNHVMALNAATGELYWRYDHPQPDDLRICCGPANRGVAIKDDMVIMGTLDSHLLAFDRFSGEILWDIEMEEHSYGFSSTAAPLIVKNMAIIGTGGGEYGVRGFFDAYDLTTQERVWRVYTIPGEGEPGNDSWAGDSWKTGGAPTWSVGAFDAATNTIMWTTGNPAPDWNGDDRAGDNLYSDSILAVDADTGEYKWHYQFTPHDVWDYDGNTTIFLADITFEGRSRQAVVQANRNGYFYIIDRVTGEFLSATQYVEQLNWATIDASGRPVPDPLTMPQTNPDVRVCPGLQGGMNGAWAGALNPDLGLAYIPTVENCMKFRKGISVYVRGQSFTGGSGIDTDASQGLDYGHLSAIDINTGEVKWRYMDADPMKAGVVSTAGGVVISGTISGKIFGLNGETGEELWTFNAGGGIRSMPIVYQQNGDTYLAIGSGDRSRTSAVPQGGQLFVFKLEEGQF
ncbi:MAG: PQQ-dependent dehydrogenase, methanol/ethanol family [SAR86 cluster bacterium]|uniref:PQQ-dependent dehydrogenase, methanol/ethanol family n=1 Tax=SAR86 cluster bacterium TaxID=2030880 RepID=A0A2A4MSX3_9GAMM|nr:MAG: PQQ-dependent dehydrogenase, methanol/ethanol family [SAR86 cluster bacterium]